MAEATMEKGLSTESSEMERGTTKMKSKQEKKKSSDREQRKWRKDRAMRVEKIGAKSREIRNGGELGVAKKSSNVTKQEMRAKMGVAK